MTAKACDNCAHQLEDRYAKGGICAKAGPPNACVCASARAIDGYYAKHKRSIDHCPKWEAKQ